MRIAVVSRPGRGYRLDGRVDPTGWLVVHVAGRDLAFDSDRVRDITVAPPVTRVPGAQPGIRGVAAVHGGVVPVIDLSERLGGPPLVLDARSTLVGVDGKLRGEPLRVGLLAEGSGRLVPVATLLPRPAGLEHEEDGPCTGFLEVEGALVPVIDVDALLAAPARTIGIAVASAAPVASAAAAATAKPSTSTSTTTTTTTSTVRPSTATATAKPTMATATSTALTSTPAAAPSPPAAPTRVIVASRGTAAVTPRVLPVRPVAASALPAVFPAASAPRQHFPVAPSTPRPAASPEGPRPARWPRLALAGALVSVALLAGLALGLRAPGAPRAPPRSATADGPAPPPIRLAPSPEPSEARPRPASFTRAEPAPPPAPPPPVAASPAPEPPRPAPAAPASVPAAPAPSAVPAVPAALAVPAAPAPVRIVPPAIAAGAAPRAPEGACPAQRVVRGDTLWGLAGQRLGNPRRWPEIFAANRDAIVDPDRIEPDEELRMPGRCRLAPAAAAPPDARR